MSKPENDPASLLLDERTATVLRAKIVAVHLLSKAQKARMFELMRTYYDEVSRDQFLTDLSKKDDVILLLDKSRQMQGFSTLVTVIVKQNNREQRGIFSGDTVIDKAFWGQRALGKAFLSYLFSKKLQQPFQPLYWLLISKGYKTYLMMANNFAEYYPRYDQPTPPATLALRDAFYAKLYADEYDARRGLVTPTQEACHLKTEVAAISQELLDENAKIAFFQQANPDWRQGVELACLARMSLRMPFQYAIKALFVDRLLRPLQRFQQAVSSHYLKRESKKR